MSAAISPAALEAERRIVTTCCANPGVIERVECDIRDFGSPKWSACMKALIEIYSEDRGIDQLVLMEAIYSKYSGAVALHELIDIDGVGIPSMIGEYSRIVRTEAARRRLRIGISAALRQIDTVSPEETLEALAKCASESSPGIVDGSTTIANLAKERFAQYVEILEARKSGAESGTGFPTGIAKLDECLGGLQPGIVTLVAARPSMGKSTLALNLTANISKTHGVHVFSLEEPREAYADRVISLASKVSTESLRNVELNKGELDRVSRGAARVRDRKGWLIDDRTGVRAEEIVRCVRLAAAANNTRVVVIDYINILKRLPGERKMDMMDEAINTFADAAKRDSMAYLVLAQLNRGLEGRDNPEPRLSDLKECGTLEERAKAVIMLHHPSEHDKKARKDQVQLLIRKNSQGRRGFAVVSWKPEFMYVGDERL